MTERSRRGSRRSEEMVWSVLCNLEASPPQEKEKALLRFIAKVNSGSPRITATDREPLYASGWDDEAIYFAITICALFNFYNRWIDATGAHPMSLETHREGGKRTALHGYVRN